MTDDGYQISHWRSEREYTNRGERTRSAVMDQHKLIISSSYTWLNMKIFIYNVHKYLSLFSQLIMSVRNDMSLAMSPPSS